MSKTWKFTALFLYMSIRIIIVNLRAKGARRTYFQGYNVPETFKMEDYSVLPPMDDLRRTIFWAPSVKTDKNGRATVEFYNNSTCREMYISAECITDDGCALSN